MFLRSCLQEVAVLDRRGDALDVRTEHAVSLQPWNVATHGSVSASDSSAGPERRAEIDPLCRAHQLDGEHVPHVVNDAAQLPRRTHRHRYDVLLAAIGWDGVHAGRVRQN